MHGKLNSQEIKVRDDPCISKLAEIGNNTVNGEFWQWNCAFPTFF